MDKAVVKAFTILEALATSNRLRGVTELAADVGMTKANVHRLLRTLASQGYVIRDEESSRYRLSLRMWEVGSHVLEQFELIDVARPYVRGLRAETGESVQLALLDRNSVLYVDKADSEHPPLRAITQVGKRMPAYCVSTGKAMLAFASNGIELLRFPLKKYTPETVTSRDELVRELNGIRRNGFAVNRGECRLGVWGIAAPIFDGKGIVVAAIGVWGSEVRFRANVSRLSRIVLRAAARISAGLGSPRREVKEWA